LFSRLDRPGNAAKLRHWQQTTVIERPVHMDQTYLSIAFDCRFECVDNSCSSGGSSGRFRRAFRPLGHARSVTGSFPTGPAAASWIHPRSFQHGASPQTPPRSRGSGLRRSPAHHSLRECAGTPLPRVGRTPAARADPRLPTAFVRCGGRALRRVARARAGTPAPTCRDPWPAKAGRRPTRGSRVPAPANGGWRGISAADPERAGRVWGRAPS
jgi:hypothetical protein